MDNNFIYKPGTIKRLDLINYYPLREIKAHDSAINCLQTLENCNTSWEDENIAYRSRSRRGYHAQLLFA